MTVRESRVNFFTTREQDGANLCSTALSGSWAWKEDLLQHLSNHEEPYLFNPYALIDRVINHARASVSLKVILVVPLWPL